MVQHGAKDRAVLCPEEEMGGVFDRRELFAEREIARWWESLSASEQRALQGPERRCCWRRGTQSSLIAFCLIFAELSGEYVHSQ